MIYLMFIGFDVLTAVTAKRTILWDETQCNFGISAMLFQRNMSLHLQG
jgi:hypothetical protein